MPARSCTVTLGEPNGVRHSVQVRAESLFEAAALGLAALKHDGWVPPPGKAARLETPRSPIQAVVLLYTSSSTGAVVSPWE